MKKLFLSILPMLFLLGACGGNPSTSIQVSSTTTSETSLGPTTSVHEHEGDGTWRCSDDGKTHYQKCKFCDEHLLIEAHQYDTFIRNDSHTFENENPFYEVVCSLCEEHTLVKSIFREKGGFFVAKGEEETDDPVEGVDYVLDIEHKTLTLLKSTYAYSLTGFFDGHIVIPDTVTKVDIELNSAAIYSYGEFAAISYEADSSRVKVKFMHHTENYLFGKKVIESENNIDISGHGKGNLFTTSSTMIKGSEIEIKNSFLNCYIISDMTPETGNKIFNAKAITVISDESSEISGEYTYPYIAVNGDVYDVFHAEINSKGKKGTIAIAGLTLILDDIGNKAFYADTSISLGSEAESVDGDITIIAEAMVNHLSNCTPTYGSKNITWNGESLK